mmetsp:Transcript_67538/g.187258  ORF Transcript_67538/g.187258 Transcript_67538/m.187258 type:complete len:204 (-) Transcript_67538:1055-1666(-)
MATHDSAIRIRNFMHHPVLDPAVLRDTPHVHSVSRRKSASRGTLQLSLLQHQLQHRVCSDQQRCHVHPVLFFLLALEVLRRDDRLTTKQLGKTCVVWPPWRSHHCPALAHKFVQLLWHIFKLLPLRASRAPALVKKTFLSLSHACSQLSTQVGDVNLDRAEAVLKLVELPQWLEPRQFSEHAIDECPTQCLQVILREAFASLC